jgi:hypothetical protein
MAARRREAAKRTGKTTGRGSGLTPRIKRAIDFYVQGADDAGKPVLRQQDAAEAVGLSARALRAAMLKTPVMAYFREQCAALREGERAASIRTIAEIRDDTALKTNAAGQKVRLTAAERLAFDTPQTSVNVSVGVGVNVSGERPGYVIDLSGVDRRAVPVTDDVVTIDHEPEPSRLREVDE